MNQIRAFQLPPEKITMVPLPEGWKFLTVLIVNDAPLVFLEWDETKLMRPQRFHVHATGEKFIGANLEYLKTFVIKDKIYHLYKEVAPCPTEPTLTLTSPA